MPLGPLCPGTSLPSELLPLCRISKSDNSISNGLDIYPSAAGSSLHIACANNDGFVRVMDVASCSRYGAPVDRATSGMKARRTHGLIGSCRAGLFQFPWPVNYVRAQPEGGKLLAVVGDGAFTPK